ncbi:MAG: potassium-transporting ATPase subunit KdpA [Phycisphaerales bacterium]
MIASAPVLVWNAAGIVQMLLYLALLLALVKPLGWWCARVIDGPVGTAPLGLGRALGWAERLAMRACGVQVDAQGRPAEMRWRTYATGILLFSAFGFLFLYGLLRLQHLLPGNPSRLGPVAPATALNAAVSFVTNTNWQSYAGETTMSQLAQALGLGVQNFLSAATGIAVLAALVRGLARRSCATIGNCWSDLTRATLYILLPLSAVLALALVSQGVVQQMGAPLAVGPAIAARADDPGAGNAQQIPIGAVASQVAIKQLGTNGGGFYNANSAHPLENPTPLSDLLQALAILALPAALCWSFGDLVRDRRQGWALLAAMLAIFVPLLLLAGALEQAPNHALAGLGIDDAAGALQAGGNMEGKEARLGIAASARWAAATTAASNGSVNAMLDSFSPLGGLIPLWLIQLGEVVFGGVGSGLYGMLMFVVVAVFVAGLMVGRTPEYLGKKIEPAEMKMAALCVLVPCALTLLGTAVAIALPDGRASASNPGPHGFSQVLYAFSSAGNNNGSAFAGFNASTPFFDGALAACMWLSRFWIVVPVLAVAGSLAAKRAVPTTAGTLPTHTPVFVGMLVAVVIVVGALTFLPALALGPIAEQLAAGASAGATPGAHP